MEHRMILHVFKIIAILTLTLILFLIVFREKGRDIMWETSQEAFKKEWINSTGSNGADNTAKLNVVFDASFDISY